MNCTLFPVRRGYFIAGQLSVKEKHSRSKQATPQRVCTNSVKTPVMRSSSLNAACVMSEYKFDASMAVPPRSAAYTPARIKLCQTCSLKQSAQWCALRRSGARWAHLVSIPLSKRVTFAGQANSLQALLNILLGTCLSEDNTLSSHCCPAYCPSHTTRASSCAGSACHTELASTVRVCGPVCLHHNGQAGSAASAVVSRPRAQ